VTDLPLGEARPVTVVKESAAFRAVFWGFLEAAGVAALVRGHMGAKTATGRIVGDTFVGIFVALIACGWLIMTRHRAQLEVSDEAIRLVNRKGPEPIALLRAWGDDLAFVRKGGVRFGYSVLMVRGADADLRLDYFRAKQIRRACLAHGWRFGRPPLRT
jgi:hypothetical protein